MRYVVTYKMVIPDKTAELITTEFETAYKMAEFFESHKWLLEHSSSYEYAQTSFFVNLLD